MSQWLFFDPTKYSIQIVSFGWKKGFTPYSSCVRHGENLEVRNIIDARLAILEIG